MPMIPDDEIDRIKRETDLPAVIRSRGVELKPQGHDLVGLCPFHEDHDPSLRVTPGKGLWRCMSCGATGNVIQFIQRFDGVSFRHAFELLKAGSAAFTGAPSGQPAKKTTIPRLPAPVAADADDQAALRQVLDYYHERLNQNPAALAYLAKRGIGDAATIAAFRIGFVDRTLGLGLPHANRKEGAMIRERLQKLGILRDTGHEHLRGRLVFPVIAEDGTIGTVYGRAIDDGGKHDRHLFLPGPQRGIFNPAALSAPALSLPAVSPSNSSNGDERFASSKSAEVILAEGIIDALTFWSAGFHNVTTGYSAKALPEELLDALVAAKVARVFIAFDRDEAGDKGADEVAVQLMARGIECRRVLFPHGLDANEYARQVQPAAKSLGVLLNAAAWIGKGRQGAAAIATAAPSLRSAAAAKAEVGMQKAELSSDTSLVRSSSLAAKAASSDSVGTKAAADAAAQSGPASKEKSPPEKAAKEKTSGPALADGAATPPRPEGSGTLPPAVPTLQPVGEYWVLTLDVREYRVGGLEKSLGTEALKLSLRLKVGDRFHLDCLDLARDADRRRFVERGAEETGLHPDLLKRDLGRLLLAVEQVQAELACPQETVTPVRVLTAAERMEALAWLTAQDLIGRLRAAFRLAGIVGEENNVLLVYLAGVSRLLERPLAVIVQSPSAAGKSMLMDSSLSFFPEECRIKYSAMTGQSLYYLGETDLKHKILAIVEEAGAEKASYALKLLQSEGELTIASTGKDPATGRMETQEYHVEGPVMIMLTTTAIDLDEELQNRCLTLAVDESPEQTARIQTIQRERRTLAGLVAKTERTELLRVLKNAQRLLATVEVLNPFAPALTFPSGRTRNRRDHEKYLTLIDAIALLHQHQRPRGRHEVAGRVVEYIEVTVDDIALANELAPEVLGRCLDELPPQTRTLLRQIRALVRSKRAAYEMPKGSGTLPPTPRQGDAGASRGQGPSPCPARLFTRRELREACGWSLTQVRAHLERLVELEYLELRHGRLGSSFAYELMVDPDAPEALAHIGLIDVAKLRPGHDYGGGVAGSESGVAGQTGGVAGGGETPPPPLKPQSSEEKPAA